MIDPNEIFKEIAKQGTEETIPKDDIYMIGVDEDSDDVLVCPHIEVTAQMANESGGQNRMLIEASSLRGSVFEASVPYQAFSSAKGFNTFLEEISSSGFVLYTNTPKTVSYLRGLLIEQVIETQNTVSIVNQSGWYNDNGFLANNTVFANNSTERAILVGDKVEGTFRITDENKIRGDLEEWQDNILEPCRFNNLFLFGIFFALYPVLLEPAGVVTGTIFHILADTSKGKTTAMRLSMSVLGSPEDLMESWKKTDNAIEGRCEMSNHLPMYLDEIHLADKSFADSVYMIANGEGKGRMTTSATLQRTKRWKTCVLSTGEKSFEQVKRLRGVEDSTQGGQTVRFLEIPGDAGKGMGNIQHLPDQFDSPKDYADYLIKVSGLYYGTAMKAYLEFATALGKEGIAQKYNEYLAEFIRKTDCDSINARVSAAFGGIYASGMLGIEAGVLTIPASEVMDACEDIFDRYRLYFKNNVDKGTGSAVNSSVMSEWNSFIHGTGLSSHDYYHTVWDSVKGDNQRNFRITKRWGEKIRSNLSGKVELRLKQDILKYVFPNSNMSQVITALDDAGWLIHRDDERHHTNQEGIYKSNVKGSKRNCLIIDYDVAKNAGVEDDGDDLTGGFETCSGEDAEVGSTF